MTKFTLNDKVSWTSQAGGYTKEKTGTVVQVVPGRTLPDTALLRHVGGPRSQESYVVHVPSKSGRGSGKCYWPVATLLKPAT